MCDLISNTAIHLRSFGNFSLKQSSDSQLCIRNVAILWSSSSQWDSGSAIFLQNLMIQCLKKNYRKPASWYDEITVIVQHHSQAFVSSNGSIGKWLDFSLLNTFFFPTTPDIWRCSLWESSESFETTKKLVIPHRIFSDPKHTLKHLLWFNFPLFSYAESTHILY